MCRVHGEDFVTVLHERWQTARKDHRCGECRVPIRPGDRYVAERYVYDGAASSHKTCADCWEYRTWLQLECGGFIYGEVREDFGEHLGEYGFYDPQEPPHAYD